MITHTCPDCGKAFRIPANAKGMFACTCGKGRTTQRQPCAYRGGQIGTLHCGCGGTLKVYFCQNLQEPCTEHIVPKHWTRVTPKMDDGYTVSAPPMVCVSCPLRLEKLPEKQG